MLSIFRSRWTYKITLSIVFLLLFSSTIIFGRNNEPSNLNLYPNIILESYTQDFSDWTGITRSGDQPNSWILNSDPAHYTVVSPGFYGTHLNLETNSISLNNYNFNVEWDVMQNAASSTSVKRFTRLYCYLLGGSVFSATLQLWDQVRSVDLNGDGGGSIISIDWDPSIWHKMKLEGRIISNELILSLYLDGVNTSLNTSAGIPENISLDYCSFYAYQNTVGSGDSIWVDNLNIYQIETSNGNETYTVDETITKSVTETHHETVTHTKTVETTDLEIITEIIETTQKKAEVSFLSISLTLLSIFTFTLIKKRKNISKI